MRVAICQGWIEKIGYNFGKNLKMGQKGDKCELQGLCIRVVSVVQWWVFINLLLVCGNYLANIACILREIQLLAIQAQKIRF